MYVILCSKVGEITIASFELCRSGYVVLHFQWNVKIENEGLFFGMAHLKILKICSKELQVLKFLHISLSFHKIFNIKIIQEARYSL